MIPEEDNSRGRVVGRHVEPLHQSSATQRRTETRPLAEAGPSSQATESESNDHRGHGGSPARDRRTLVESDEKKSIDVVFDLSDPEQAERLELHKSAFGEGYTKVETLGESMIVLKIYPGRAKELL